MNATPQHAPLPSLPTLDCQRFREMLAGLYSISDDDAGAMEEYRTYGIRIGKLLARYFGPSLEVTTKWDRIGTAISSACAKVPNGEPEPLLSEMLEHVKAETVVASDSEFAALLLEIREKPLTWKEGLVSYLSKCLYAVLTFAREEHVVQRDEAMERRKRRAAAKNDQTLSSFVAPEGEDHA